EGKSYLRQAGLHSDKMIEGFSMLTERVRQNGSRIFAQLAHGGRQSLVQGVRPAAPSFGMPDLIYKVVPRSMGVKEILKAIQDFGSAALRAKKAGFDGIQIHGAHGYLVNEFLSPYFNRRTDEWGGTPENRFRFLKRVYESIRESVGTDYPITIKLNVSDHTPGTDIPIEEVVEQATHLVAMGIDAIEISCGTLAYSMFHSSRGKVPVKGFSRTQPILMQPLASFLLNRAFPEENYTFEEAYNLWASSYIKPVLGDVPLILVGGLRTFQTMEPIVQEGKADFISLSRPLIREPFLVKKWQEEREGENGNWRIPTCLNCNKCYVGVANHKALTCNEQQVF
ncbi:MAG TPA: NADH:flavin oxidoreductase, partial [Anaerolineae bacterium]|nr:NADH:flavin oxidoreductase [Anaerolineae bacterium]